MIIQNLWCFHLELWILNYQKNKFSCCKIQIKFKKTGEKKNKKKKAQKYSVGSWVSKECTRVSFCRKRNDLLPVIQLSPVTSRVPPPLAQGQKQHSRPVFIDFSGVQYDKQKVFFLKNKHRFPRTWIQRQLKKSGRIQLFPGKLANNSRIARLDNTTVTKTSALTATYLI